MNFEREYQPLPPGTKILLMPEFSHMPDEILGKKKYEDVFEKFLYEQTSFEYRLGTAKISLKNLHSFWSYQEKT